MAPGETTHDIWQYTNLATDMTIHIMHILEQYIRGHITGVNSCR